MGLAAGLGVAYYAYLQSERAGSPTSHAVAALPLLHPAPTVVPAKAVDTAVAVEPAPGEGDFDFYTILPEMQMAVPEPILATPAPIPNTNAVVVPTPAPIMTAPERKPEVTMKLPKPEQVKGLGGVYILQVGTFRQQRDAKGMKARLATLGFEAKIQTVTNNRNTVHRVRIGPLSDLSKINTLRSRLHGSNINAVVLKISS